MTPEEFERKMTRITDLIDAKLARNRGQSVAEFRADMARADEIDKLEEMLAAPAARKSRKPRPGGLR